MPEFLEDPSILTKDQLKSELVVQQCDAPGGEQSKDVYVQIYLQHLTARNWPPLAASANSKGPPDFSSDEEREPTPLPDTGARGRAAVGRVRTPRPQRPAVDVLKLCLNTGTTRKLYEKKLLKLREQGTESRSSTPLPTISSSENTRQNGNNDSDRYSDNEEDSKIELKLEKREPLKGRAKTPVTLKQRRIEHNQVDTSQHFRIDGAVISETIPIAETVMASSNESLVVNRVTGNFKHAAPILPITEFSDIPRRTPKKPLTRAEVGEKTEERRVERDILKEMFPFEAATPTGISASCRRPIKGAAGRPLERSDYRMEESFSSKYVPKYVPLADVKTEKTKKGRFIPMWIKILLFVVVAVFLFLVYQAMETNQENPFFNFYQPDSEKSD
uniref:Thymopoietin n=1 Tax=Cavia porcellus TaxID=10141 RepID=A0A286XGA2_CAVPO